MSQQRLTDRTLAPYVDEHSLIHIVNTGDTIQYSGGSSYKISLGSLQPIFSGNSGSFVTGGTYNSVTGTLTLINSTGGTNSITGFTTGGTVTSYGIFGISDNLGEYTYYSTLQSAINAASSGDVIQMFANVTESSAVTVILKDGVDLNMNGYTYTLDGSFNNNCLTDNNLSVNCKIYNGNIVRSGSVYVNDITSLCLYVRNSSTTIETSGVYFISPTTTGINSNGTIRGVIVDSYTRGVVNSGKLYSSNVISQFETAIYCDSTNSEVYDCIGRSNGLGFGVGMLMPSFAGVLRNSVGYSLGNAGIYAANVSITQSCVGYSNSSDGMAILNSIAHDCKGYSSAGVGVELENVFLGTNILGYSFTFIGLSATVPTNGVNSKLENLVASSTSNIGCLLGATGTGTLVVKNLQSTSLLSGVSGNACRVSGNNNIKIMGGSFDVWNSAECLTSSSPITVSFANLTFKTSAVPPVNTNITQGSGTIDTYGNVVV